MTARYSDSISVVDGSTGFLFKIPVGKDPLGIAVNPSTNKVYVANAGSDTVSIIEGHNGVVQGIKSQSEIPGIAVDLIPIAIAVNPSNNKVYVANFPSNTVSVIDGDGFGINYFYLKIIKC